MEKRFVEVLWQAGVRRGEMVVFADELLLGQVRRRWVARGVKLRHEWLYLLVAAEPVAGRLWWAWLEQVQGKEVAKVMEKWKSAGVGVVVWDNAAFHMAEGRVRSLIGWNYISQALQNLPQ